MLNNAIKMLSSSKFEGQQILVEQGQTIEINNEVLGKVINIISNDQQLNPLERIIAEVGILTNGGYQIEGKVNSESDFNEISFEIFAVAIMQACT
ncbi:hypothetical protein LCGC14_1502730 [marine sediment metagenome]|uniref:Uncharacterized protein n=1 Tax=marine sediment metagenome TaxID=412755 RepID=A0A0F9J456_9ZZZZ